MRVPALLCLDPKLRSDERPNAEERASCQAEFDALQLLVLTVGAGRVAFGASRHRQAHSVSRSAWS